MNNGPTNKNVDHIKDLMKLASGGPTDFDEFSEKFDLIKDTITPEMLLQKIPSTKNRAMSLFELSTSLLIETYHCQPFIKIWENYGSLFDINKLCEVRFTNHPKLNFFNILALAAALGQHLPLKNVINTFHSTLPLELIKVSEIKDFDKHLSEICATKMLDPNNIRRLFSHEFKKLITSGASLKGFNGLANQTMLPSLPNTDKMYQFENDFVNLNKLSFLCLAALSEVNSSGIFLLYWQSFKSHIPFKQIIQQRVYKSKSAIIAYESPIFYLIDAAKKGNPEPLITVLQYYKDQITLDDLTTLIHTPSYVIPLHELLSDGNPSIDLFLQELISDSNATLKVIDPCFVLRELPSTWSNRIPSIMNHPDFNMEKSINGVLRTGNIDVALYLYGSNLFTERLFFIYSAFNQLGISSKVQLIHAFALNTHLSTMGPDSRKAKLICDYVESTDSEKQSLGYHFIQNMINEHYRISDTLHYQGWTPFLAAVASNNVPVIDLILNSQSKLFTTTDKGVNTFTILATLENTSVLTKILHKLKNELGEAVFFQQIIKMLINKTSTNSNCRQNVSADNISYYIIPKNYELDDFLSHLINEKMVSLVTLDPSMQRNIYLALGNQVEFNPAAVQALINQSLEFLCEHNLVNYSKGFVIFDKDKPEEIAKSKLLQNLANKYKWLTPIRGHADTLSLNSRPPTQIDGNLHFATITIHSFYEFFNELSQGLQSIQDNLRDNDRISFTALTAGIPNTPNATLNTSKAPQIQTDTIKTSEAKPKNFKANSHPDNLVSSSPKPAESQKRKAKKNKVSTSKKRPVQPTQIAPEKSQEISTSTAPLPKAAEYIYTRASDKPFDFKIQDNNKAAHKATSNANSSINEEINMVSNIVNTNDLQRLLDGLATDPQTATMILRLTCMYGILKLNRQLAVNNRGFYRLNCDLIHGSYETLFEEFKKPDLENSQLWLFLKNTFGGNVFNYNELLIIEREKFYTSSKQALGPRSSTAATYKRLHLIKSLIEFIKTIKPYLDKNLEGYQFYKNAFAATIIVLGEQYARLCEFAPALVTNLHKTAAGATLIKYRDYRNLHHGVNTAPSIATFQNDDQEYQAFINFDTDWDDQLLELINDLNDDIHCLGDFTLAANLQSMITELENKLEKSSTPLIYSSFRQAIVLQENTEVEELEKLNEQMGNLKLNPGH